MKGKVQIIGILFVLWFPLGLVAQNSIKLFSAQDTTWVDRLNGLIAEHCAKRHAGDTLIVFFEEGRYFVDKPLLFGDLDKRTVNGPIVFQGLGDVIFTGGILLDNERFRPLPEELRGRIYDPKVADRILAYQLADGERGKLGELACAGFARAVQPVPSMLFRNGERMTLARYPNTGSVEEIRRRKTVIPIRKIIDPGMAQVKIPGEAGAMKSRHGVFECQEERMKRWEQADDIWVDGIFARDWAWSLNKVKGVDSRRHAITLEYPEKYDLRAGGSFFFVCNLLEEIDTPGEYYIDRKKRTVYCYLPEKEEKGKLELSVIPFTFFRLSNMQDVSFRNLHFELGRDGGIVLDNCSRVAIEKCTFRNLGTTAVSIDGSDNSVSDCVLSAIGGTAVSLDGGDPQTLSPAGNRVERCEISDWAFYYRVYNSAVSLKGIGNCIENNHLSDAPHGAIVVSGNNHVIKENEIERVCLEFKDFGAIYSFTGANQEMRGHQVVGNYFHDIGLDSDGVYAVYMDECSAGWNISRNIFHRIGGGNGFVSAIFTNTGYDIKIDKNIFIDCSQTFLLSCHFTTWGKERYKRYFKPNWEKKLGNRGNLPPIYYESYPSLKSFMKEDWFWTRSCFFTDNLIYNNSIPLKHSGKFFVTRSSDVQRSDSLVQSAGNRWLEDTDALDIVLPSLGKAAVGSH